MSHQAVQKYPEKSGRKDPEKSGKIRKNPENTGWIRKNPEKTGKNRKNPEKSGKIGKNAEKFGKEEGGTRGGVRHPPPTLARISQLTTVKCSSFSHTIRNCYPARARLHVYVNLMTITIFVSTISSFCICFPPTQNR